MFMSICAFSIMDIIVKWSEHYPLGQVLFFRGFFGIVFYFIIPRERHIIYFTKDLGYIFKMFFWFNSFSGNIHCFEKFTLSNFVSISFTAPIFTTIFSIFIGWKSWCLQMVSSHCWIYWNISYYWTRNNLLNIYYIFPIILYWVILCSITIRKLSSTEPVWLISLYFSIYIKYIFNTLRMDNAINKRFFNSSNDRYFWRVANLWLSQSYKYSEVSLVTPLKYLALVFAIIFGYLIWDEIQLLKVYLVLV